MVFKNNYFSSTVGSNSHFKLTVNILCAPVWLPVRRQNAKFCQSNTAWNWRRVRKPVTSIRSSPQTPRFSKTAHPHFWRNLAATSTRQVPKLRASSCETAVLIGPSQRDTSDRIRELGVTLFLRDVTSPPVNLITSSTVHYRGGQPETAPMQIANSPRLLVFTTRHH